MSSHQIADVEQIADHVCIIHQGRATVTGSLDDLKTEYCRLHVVLDREEALPLPWAGGIEHVRQEGRVLSILGALHPVAVSRTRLLITRAALGFAEMMIVMVLVSVAAWAAFGAMRAQASMSAVIGHAVFIGIAAVGVAGLAVLGSTVFDDVVQTWIVTAVTILLFVFRAQLPRPLDLIGAMTGGSPLVSSTVPWATLAAALVVGTLCVVAALRVVTVQEY